MTNADDRIVSFLHNEGSGELIANPAAIAVNIDFGPHTVRQRVGPLRESGLIQYYDERRGLYRLTDRGSNYLPGRLDDGDIASIEAPLDGE